MSKLELYNIYAGYEESKPVLKDISFFVEKGEFIVLLGTSGCGKTTILNLIAGMIPISAGELYIDGVKSNDTPPRKRNIAMVFQNYALYPTMTAYENIAFPLQNAHYKKKDIDSSVKSIAVELGIDDLLERKPAEMSGGQQQRVAIARALVRKPSLLLMDEPLSNLDSALRNQLQFEIKKLHKSIGATIVYVTHDQAEALTLASRIILLSNGMIQQIGTPHEVFYEPANEFVATFLGNPKINLFSNCDVVIRAQLHYTQLFSNELVLEELNVKDVNIDAIDIGLPKPILMRSMSPISTSSRRSFTAFCAPMLSFWQTSAFLKWMKMRPFSSCQPFFADKLMRSSSKPYRSFASLESASNSPSVNSACGILKKR